MRWCRRERGKDHPVSARAPPATVAAFDSGAQGRSRDARPTETHPRREAQSNDIKIHEREIDPFNDLDIDADRWVSQSDARSVTGERVFAGERRATGLTSRLQGGSTSACTPPAALRRFVVWRRKVDRCMAHAERMRVAVRTDELYADQGQWPDGTALFWSAGRAWRHTQAATWSAAGIAARARLSGCRFAQTTSLM